MTPDELKADELLLAQRQQEADSDGRGTLRELVVESAKYEAPRRLSFTGVTAPLVVQPTTATNGLPSHSGVPGASGHSTHTGTQNVWP